MDSDDDVLYDEDGYGSDTEEEEEDDEYVTLEPEYSSTSGKHKGEDFQYNILTADDVVQHMGDCVAEVSSVVQIPATTTRMLLNYFRWDQEKLMERYYGGNQEEMFSAAHVMSPFEKSLSSDGGSAKNLPAETVCEICFLPMPSNMMNGLECEHKFCSMCWKDYLTTKIMDEGRGRSIACAAHDCHILVDDANVMKLVSDPRVKLKYQQLITNGFVESNRLLRWCPKPDCDHVVKVAYCDAKPVTCACSHTFCFACGENCHDPVKCVWLQKWVEKWNDDSETFNWIAANTKKCPRCKSSIEKDGGCDHIACQTCGFDFCWVCLRSWERHDSRCTYNRYDTDTSKNARNSHEESQSARQRYLFYRNRYMNHMLSLKSESKLYTNIEFKMGEMQQQHGMSEMEVHFLKKAVDVLSQCRQTLMYTNVFAYYLKKNNQSVMFEENQMDLEEATEKLSGYLERDITSDMLVNIKQKVHDMYKYCESRRKKTLDHVHEGYEKDIWEHQDLR